MSVREEKRKSISVSNQSLLDVVRYWCSELFFFHSCLAFTSFSPTFTTQKKSILKEFQVVDTLHLCIATSLWCTRSFMNVFTGCMCVLFSFLLLSHSHFHSIVVISIAVVVFNQNRKKNSMPLQCHFVDILVCCWCYLSHKMCPLMLFCVYMWVLSKLYWIMKLTKNFDVFKSLQLYQQTKATTYFEYNFPLHFNNVELKRAEKKKKKMLLIREQTNWF